MDGEGGEGDQAEEGVVGPGRFSQSGRRGDWTSEREEPWANDRRRRPRILPALPGLGREGLAADTRQVQARRSRLIQETSFPLFPRSFFFFSWPSKH